MHRAYSDKAFPLYVEARAGLVRDPAPLLALEEFLAKRLFASLSDSLARITEDYDAASTLYPFWKNYPPDNRGRMPIGDQHPWIEVGEHAVGFHIVRLLSEHFDLRDIGFPTGADQRYLLAGPELDEASLGFCNHAWLLIDIKSCGPRDDVDHVVMSHNQVSGSGEWASLTSGVTNQEMKAEGARTSHNFSPALPPLLVLPTLALAPTVTLVVRPVYGMEPWVGGSWSGQPLIRLEVISIPNGLLLSENPAYLSEFPRLLFPGKDDHGKDARKRRARVSLGLLRELAPWRHQSMGVTGARKK